MLKNKKRILLILFIITICFIFGHSLMPAEVSQGESGRLLAFLTPFLKLFLPERLISDHLIRKAAHFSEYALLGFETGLLSCDNNLHNNLHKWSTCLTAGLFTAFIDETIQLFVEGRSGEVRDIWIDLLGFIAGLLLAAVIEKLIQTVKEKRSGKDGVEADIC